MTTAAAIEPRKVVRGTLNETTGIYTLYLDNGSEVDTESAEIAKTASVAAKAGQALLIDTERRQGRLVVTELRVAPADQPPTTTPATTAVMATRPTAPTALAQRPDLPTGLISDPRALTDQLTHLQAHYHVMSPAVSIGQMAEGFGANLAVVQIDPTIVFNKEETSGSGPDCYWSKSIHGADTRKRSLRKEGLLKLSQAAGIQWLPGECRRLDDGKERYLWRWQYYGVVRTHDGQLQPVQGTKELDLRDGSADAKAAASARHLDKMRQNGNEVCETKAMLRAIRSLRVQQVYTVDELKKPFLIVRFSFTPDMSDPEIKKLVTQQAMAGIGALYTPSTGHTLPALPAPAADAPAADDVDLDVDAPTGAASAPPAAPATKKPNPFADESSIGTTTATIPDGSTTIVEVKKASGVKKKDGKPDQPWAKYDVTFETGEVATTFSQTIQQLVDDAYRQKARVRITTSEREGYNDNLDSLEIVDKRQQSLPDPGDL